MDVDRLHGLLKMESEAAWKEEIACIASQLGYDFFLFALTTSKSVADESLYLHTSYPAAWQDRYRCEQMHEIDPTVFHCFKSTIPLRWDPSLFKLPESAQMYEEASSYGLKSGITLPLRSLEGARGMFCAVNDVNPVKDSLVTSLSNISILSLFCDFILESGRVFHSTKGTDPLIPKLTNRELEILKWLVSGKTTWEISMILNCSEANVEFHIKNLRRKFHVGTRRQVIIRAISLGLVHPY